MCGLSEFGVTDNELTLRGELASECMVTLRLTDEGAVRRYAADFARLVLPKHECGEGRIDLHRDGGDVVVRLRMMAVGTNVDVAIDPVPNIIMWGMRLPDAQETAPARLYDRAGDDRQGEDERGRGLGPGVETHTVVVEDDGSMTVKFSTSWRG